jgi:hypothetical protein
MAKKDAAAAPDAKLYALGPQSDGSIVVRVPDDFALMCLRKAVEKQEKNATAADGTISALAEGDDPFLDRVQRTLGKLKALIAGARAPENQIADTPIGKALAEATRAATAGEQPEAIDGDTEGNVWAPHVPRPRPKVGQLVKYPTGQGVSIVLPTAYNDNAENGPIGFSAKTTDDMIVTGLVAHQDGEDVVWRLSADASKYETPTVKPNVADELKAAANAAPIADEKVDAKPASKTAAKKTAAKTTPAKSSAQRERNAQSAGIRPVPKPSQAKKRGGGK